MTALPLAAALAWTLALIVDGDPLGTTGAFLTGVGLLLIASVAVVGLTVTGSRWSHRLAVISVTCGLVVAGLRPIDGFWLAGLFLSVSSAAALFLPSVTGRVRRLPAASGPPGTAVLLTLLLVSVPFVIGLTTQSSEPWAALSVGLSAPLVGFAYARVIPGGLLAVRVIWPLLSVGLAPFLSVSAAAAAVVLAIGVAALSRRREVKASFHPPREPGTSYPIPPELAPPEILDAAGLDDKGRRK